MKALFFSLTMLLSIAGFSHVITLDNQTPYPSSDTTMTIQWAKSEKEIEKENKALLEGKPLDKARIKDVVSTGKVRIDLPKKAEYFRVLTWTKKRKTPEHHTNWVEVVPSKSYTLHADHLVPTVLMAGTGC